MEENTTVDSQVKTSFLFVILAIALCIAVGSASP